MSTYERVRSNGSDGSDDTGGNSVASSVEAPPFALLLDDPSHQPKTTLNSGEEEESEELLASPTPALTASDVWSSTMTDVEKSTLQSTTNSRTIHPNESSPEIPTLSTERDDDGAETYVLNASDSILGSSSYMVGRSPSSGSLWTHDTTQNEHPAAGSMDFSQLMRQADDRHVHQSTFAQSRMPPIEETAALVDSNRLPTSISVSSNVTPQTTNCCGNNWLYSMFFGPSHPPNLSAVPMMRLSPALLDGRIYEGGRNIQAARLGENTFEVSMQIDPPCTVRDVMDVVGNPDLLRLWCDPIKALVITKSSEGARSATNRRETEGENREYEGEWIEATTSALVSPSEHSSFLYSLGSVLWTALGFPSYGKVTMFVERPRYQVGLTVGPFSGGVMASHTIKIQDDGPVVSVVDTVRLSRDEETCGLCYCCGLICDPVKRCFMPGLASHMEQSLASMMRLRVLVEHGEESIAAVHSVVDEGHGGSSTPLLCSSRAFS